MVLMSALNQFIPFIPPIILKISVPILAMLPFIEIGLAIPYGIIIVGLTPFEAAALALTGHIIAILIVTPLIYKHGESLEQKHSLIKKLINHARKVRLDRFFGIRELGIIAFIALPLPIGGIWYALPAAFIFNVPKKKTIFCAIVGSILGSIQFTLLWTGVFGLIKLWFFNTIEAPF